MNRDKLLLIVLAVIVGAVIVIVVPTIWSDNETDERQPTTQEAFNVDETSYENVALEAATIMTTWHPADDFNRTDAELRASHLMTDERANRIEQPERPATGLEWNEAAQHNATSQPAVEINYFTDVDAKTVAVLAEWEWITDDDSVTIQSNEERIYYFAFNDQGEIHDYTYETLPRHQEKEN